jgi:hypothetical protein
VVNDGRPYDVACLLAHGTKRMREQKPLTCLLPFPSIASLSTVKPTHDSTIHPKKPNQLWRPNDKQEGPNGHLNRQDAALHPVPIVGNVTGPTHGPYRKNTTKRN